MTMIRNFLQVALRYLVKNRLFSAVNVLGLSIGMTCCFLILLYASYEASYDRFHPNLDRLHRVNYHANFGSQEMIITRIPAPIGPELPEFFPEIEQSARFYPRSIGLNLTDGDEQFEVEDALFADSTALDVFRLDFLAGDARRALDRPFSLVVTDEAARRFFGTTQALGRSVRLAGQGPFTVTGVVRAWPDNAHLHFDLLAPYDNMLDVEPAFARETIGEGVLDNWLASHSYTYVLLKEGQPAGAVNAKFPAFLQQFGDPKFRDKQRFALFPVRDIHLHSPAQGEPEPTANRTYLSIFLLIGLLTLGIAAINFVNLSLAVSLGRAREVGVRKVLGAGRGSIAGQFLSESVLLCAFAFLLALGLTRLALPFLNELTERAIPLTAIVDGRMLLLFTGIFLLTGLLAGSYPAFVISRLRPVITMKGYEGAPGAGLLLRRVLIGIQFLVAIALIGGTTVIFGQLDFLRNRPLGFRQEQMLTLPLFSANMNTLFAPGDQGLRDRMTSFEEELLRNPRVEAVTLSSGRPGFGGVRFPVVTDSIRLEDNVFFQNLSVDYNFAETYGLELVAGRDFDRDFGTDHLDGYLLNERAVAALGWPNPAAAIGRRFVRGGKEGKVVGVVKDFNFENLRTDIQPLVLDVAPASFAFFSVRLQNEQIPATIDFIRAVWDKYFPQKVFEYTFLDESLQDLYSEETRLSSIIGYFAFLAIFISCFGLFGLVAYTIHRRAREIGIRKVLGAGIGHLLLLLSSDFLRLIALAGLLALPLTWYGLHHWLAGYAYHVDIRWWHLALPVPLVVAVAFLALAALTLRAATANPVETLKEE